jgi:hypothetical protein
MSVLRIRDVYPGSEFSIPDPGSKRSRIDNKKIEVLLTQNFFTKLSEVSSGYYPSRILDPDPWVKITLDPESGSATLINVKQVQEQMATVPVESMDFTFRFGFTLISDCPD